MGQRSQIYFRVNRKDGTKFIIGRYFQWNYGTRMISRARGLLEWLQGMSDYPESLFSYNSEKIPRIMEVNFDYKDVVLSRDIVADCKDPDYGWTLLFNDDNNDGKLMVDMIVDYATRDKKGNYPVTIKYAFTDWDNSNPMNGEEYMQWDTDYGDAEDSTPWRENEYIKNEIKYTERNIKKIDKIAKLMTQKELEEYINYDYSKEN